MTTTVRRRPAIAVATAAAADLCEALGLPLPFAARPGAVGLLAPPVLLRAADGWVHPGPPTAWDDFAAMVGTLGAHGTVTREGMSFPDVSTLDAEVVDREAGAWLLPAVAVRSAPATAPAVPVVPAGASARGAHVVVLGFAWAVPLAGLVLRALGADVTRVVDSRRVDPFPLRDALARDQAEVPLDLGRGEGTDRMAALLRRADLLVDGTTPRVLGNVGLGDATARTVRIAAFAADDRPGYGIAAEARGGWAARHDPPRLGRSSVADPIGGLLAALAAVLALQAAPGADARVSLESAVGHLLAREHADG